jgi:hypothetical protein
LVFAITFTMGTLALGEDLTGSILNGTTRKPAGGDEVVLLSWGPDGMTELARVKADSAGHFRFATPDAQRSYLVRVVHQGVAYHKVAESGAQRLSVQVYDVAERLSGVSAVMDVQRFEATGKVLEVKQLVTMRNASTPPRTLMNDRPFAIQLPPQAEIVSGLVQTSGGQPLKQKPVRGDQPGQYYFPYPLRPGDTGFAVVYRMPYNGEAVIEPKVRNPQERIVVMLPKSMSFEPRAANVFRPMPDTTPDNVQGTEPLSPNQVVAFRISGTGVLEELQGQRKQQQENKEAQVAVPGGGLAPPIDAPDPLHESRWWILGGFTVLLGIGAVRSMNKKPRLRSSTPSLIRTTTNADRRSRRKADRTGRAAMGRPASTFVKRR